MSSVSVGDIYKIRIEYEDDPIQWKVRPVVIIDVDGDTPVTVTIAEITSVPPRDPLKYHDQFKVEIKKWVEAGLEKPSFAKIHKVKELPVHSLYGFIGRMDYMDLMNIILVINET